MDEKCKFLKEDVILGIKHEICDNPKMRKNKCEDSERLPCMGDRCGLAEKMTKNS